VLYLGNSGSRYLHYNGSTYNLSGAGLTVGGDLSAGAGTFSGAVTMNAGGSVAYGTSFVINTTQSFSSPTPSNFMIQGGVPTIAFHYPGSFGSNFSMNSDGRFYKGGWSNGGAYHLFWTNQDGNMVTSHMMVYVGDYYHNTYQGFVEPYGRNASVTGCQPGAPDFVNQRFDITLRYAQHQIYLANYGWVAVSGA
jgi:hypothetical protein